MVQKTLSRPLRVGIIGTGAICDAHIDAYLAFSERCELVALADALPGRAAEKAAARGLDVQAFDSAEDMLREANLDLVSIATPPATHAPLAKAALAAGTISFVEKPTVLSLAEVDELLAAEAETGIPVLTVVQHRFGEAAVLLRGLIESGKLGRPLVATCETLWYRDEEYFRAPWRGLWQTEGGGPTMGHGIHQFDLLLSLLGPWREVTAIAARQARATDTEDVSMALVTFENGAVASIVNSVISPRETSHVRIDFEHATVEVEHLYGYTFADWTFTPAPGFEHLSALWSDTAADGTTSSHRDQLGAILTALDEGSAPPVGLSDVRRTLELAAAIYASAFRRTPVAAGEIVASDAFNTSMSGNAVPWPSVKGGA